MKFAFALLILLASVAGAEDAPKPPQITDAQRAQYWRAQAEALAAQISAQRAAQAFDLMVKQIQDYCGPTRELQSINGEPFCAEKKNAAAVAAH